MAFSTVDLSICCSGIVGSSPLISLLATALNMCRETATRSTISTFLVFGGERPSLIAALTSAMNSSLMRLTRCLASSLREYVVRFE